MINPSLLQTTAISEDAKERANLLLSQMTSPMGAYTNNSKGHVTIRQSVAKYIKERDGLEDVDYENIYMTNGASEGVRLAMKMINRNFKQGTLIPIPQYPLYSAQITLDGGAMVSYFLEEERNWGVNI